MNVTPKMVSGRVVKISNASSGLPWISKRISAPSERPIQFLCVSLSDSDQSIRSSPSRRRCAYALTRRHHCHIFFCSTGYPPRTDRPSLTSSLASTVPSFGHQFTTALARYARRQFISASLLPLASILAQSSAERTISFVHAASSPSVPYCARCSSSSAIGLALLALRSYHELNILRNAHCVQR